MEILALPKAKDAAAMGAQDVMNKFIALFTSAVSPIPLPFSETESRVNSNGLVRSPKRNRPERRLRIISLLWRPLDTHLSLSIFLLPSVQ